MIFLSIGSNLKSFWGSKIDNIHKCINLISKFSKIKDISKFYKTPSYPNKLFPNFVNVIIKIEFYSNPYKLLKNLKLIEKYMGRLNNTKNSPRVCDIDIIDYNGEIIHIKLGNHKVNTPHKRMHNRNFVLFPLYELDKDWVHPKFNKNIVILMSNLTSDQLLGIKIA